MSYILDSLGKAEQARQVSQAPELAHVLGQHTKPVRQSRWPTVFFIIFSTVVAFVLGVVARPGLETAWNLIHPNQIASDRIASASDPIKGYAQRIKTDAPVETEVVAKPVVAAPVKPAVPPASPVSNLAPNPAPIPVTEPVLKPANVTPAIADNPDDITISVISYSDQPQQRFAMINGAIVKEGDVLAEGYEVVQINNETVDVRLNSKQYTLRLN